MDQQLPEIVQLLRAMKGSSQAVLASASDGNFYVIKMPGRTQGPNTLCNEAVAYELYRSFWLPVPEWTCAFVSPWMIENNLDCWPFSADVLPSAGLCFASRFMGLRPKVVYDLLPGPSLARVANRDDFLLAWVIDALAHHNSYRQALFARLPDSKEFTGIFIDHCQMFGGSDGLEIPTHLRAQYWDTRVYSLPDAITERLLLERLRRFDADVVTRSLRSVPEAWKTSSAMMEISNTLNRLSDYKIVRTTFEQILECIETSSRKDKGSESLGPANQTGHLDDDFPARSQRECSRPQEVPLAAD